MQYVDRGTETKAPDASSGDQGAGRRSGPRVRSAARVVEVLQAVARADAEGISATAIAARLGIPRQVVYHLAHTLIGMDMLRKAGRGSYVLGLGAAILADGFRRQAETTDLLVGYAARAAKATGESAHVVGWKDGEIAVLARARGRGDAQAPRPGLRLDGAELTAVGRLLLAMAREDDAARYLEGRGRRDPATIAVHGALMRELAEIRRDWLSVERRGCGSGVFCIAVPLGPVPSSMALGISVHSEPTEDVLAGLVERLRKVAASRDG